MANTKPQYEPDSNEGCDMLQELKQVKANQQKEPEMPHMTTTDKLMSPGSKEVDG